MFQGRLVECAFEGFVCTASVDMQCDGVGNDMPGELQGTWLEDPMDMESLLYANRHPVWGSGAPLPLTADSVLRHFASGRVFSLASFSASRASR